MRARSSCAAPDRALAQLPPLELIQTTPPGRRVFETLGLRLPRDTPPWRHGSPLPVEVRTSLAPREHLRSFETRLQRPASTDSWKGSPSGRRLLDPAPSRWSS